MRVLKKDESCHQFKRWSERHSLFPAGTCGAWTFCGERRDAALVACETPFAPRAMIIACGHTRRRATETTEESRCSSPPAPPRAHIPAVAPRRWVGDPLGLRTFDSAADGQFRDAGLLSPLNTRRALACARRRDSTPSPLTPSQQRDSHAFV